MGGSPAQVDWLAWQRRCAGFRADAPAPADSALRLRCTDPPANRMLVAPDRPCFLAPTDPRTTNVAGQRRAGSALNAHQPPVVALPLLPLRARPALPAAPKLPPSEPQRSFAVAYPLPPLLSLARLLALP